MSFSDIFKAKEYKKENERLCAELQALQSMLTPEMQDARTAQLRVQELTAQIGDLDARISSAAQMLQGMNYQLTEKRKMLLDMDDELLFQEFSLYKPKYDLMKSEDYAKRITSVRDRQKQLIKGGHAVTGNQTWTVNNSQAQGKKMVSDIQKLILRAFNSECDELIDRVTYSNIEQSEKRIKASCDNISKLGKVMFISITTAYADLKLEELHLVFEYRQAKQREKEEQKELKAKMREEAKLQKEIEEARKKAEKEQKHYSNALADIEKRLLFASETEKKALEEKRDELKNQLATIDKHMKDIDYREANAKAGYVYIISNVGAFGENVYKIGMTRRLEPLERIDELGDASVPFDFDVHAMIFSDNAPALEAALHKAFENKKLNMINQRREFFNVTLDEIKEVVKKNFDKSVEFTDVAPAQQYRESLKMRQM